MIRQESQTEPQGLETGSSETSFGDETDAETVESEAPKALRARREGAEGMWCRDGISPSALGLASGEGAVPEKSRKCLNFLFAGQANILKPHLPAR